jgi:naphthoate synthase/2-ketocyclohexanecarboxyl-CoA hydrolase
MNGAEPPYEDLLYEQEGGVATITLNRPAALNALQVQTFEELERAIRRADGDPATGVVVIAGSLDSKAFCAGGDVRMATGMTTTEAIREHYVHRMQRLSWLIVMAGKPVVCVVHGACVGGGAELALFCDVVIAAQDSYFCFNGTEIGGSSWWGAPQLLPLMVGLRRSEEILYSSRRVGGAEAAEIGLATRAVPRAELAAAGRETCEMLLARSEEGVRLTKAALRATKEILLSTMSSSAEAAVAAHQGSDVLAAFEHFLRGERIDWRARRES